MFLFHTLKEYLFPEPTEPEPTEQRKSLRRLVRHGHRLKWFTYIFDCLRLTEHENLQLRRSCKLFSEALKPFKGTWTSFPHPEYSTLTALFARFRALSISGSTNIPKLVLIENGIHDEGGNKVGINMSISIIGESREHCIVLGGLQMNGNGYINNYVNISNLTVRGSKDYGIEGRGVSIHLDNVSVENSGRDGVDVDGTIHSTMKNCNVSHSKKSGLRVSGDGLMTISGKDTTIHHNCTDGDSWDYGLKTYSGFDNYSSIHLVSPLTIKDNGGGGNYGGKGTIAIVDNEGTIIETIQKFVLETRPNIPPYWYEH